MHSAMACHLLSSCCCNASAWAQPAVQVLGQVLTGCVQCPSAETLSMGLHMPAKSVVFSQLRKFDGVRSRWLSAGEYLQMSGRAGRRGVDSRGEGWVQGARSSF